MFGERRSFPNDHWCDWTDLQLVWFSMRTSQIPSLPAQWAGGKTRPLIGSSCWIVNCRCVMCWQRLDTKTRLFNIWCQWKPHDQLNRKCVTPLLNPPSLAPPPLPPPSLCHRFHRLIFTEPGGTINPRWVSITSVCQQIKAWASFFTERSFRLCSVSVQLLRLLPIGRQERFR